MEVTIKRKEFNSQCKSIVFNVYKYLKSVFPNENKIQIKHRVVAATGVSLDTIGRILSESVALQALSNSDDEITLSSPKKLKRLCTKTNIPEWEETVIRNTIYNFYKTEGCRVTLTQLQEKLSEEYDFSGKRTSLHTIIKKLGFRWRKTKNSGQVLIEKTEIRAARLNYLDKIKYYRSQGRLIVFLDETYIHDSWADNRRNGLRLVVVHAGGEMGFIPNSLLVFESRNKSGDYIDDMNSLNYEKWLTEKLIPNLPSNCVVVTDDAPYHTVQVGKAPTCNSRKTEMVDWLISKNIPFSPNLLKPQLYEIIKRNEKQHIVYKFDRLLEQNGHVALRLPPHHPDLNPLEMIWAQVKSNVADKSLLIKSELVKSVSEKEFSSVTIEDWMECCQQVVKFEDNYLENEKRVDVLLEDLTITACDSDSSDDDDFENLSD